MYVDAKTGQVGLIAHWARGVFEKVAGVRKSRRSGNDYGAYDGFRAEVRSVSGLLPWDGQVHGGLRLCDGTDKHYAMNVADDGTYIIDCSDEDELPGESAGSSWQPLESRHDLVPGYVLEINGVRVDDGLLGDDLQVRWVVTVERALRVRRVLKAGMKWRIGRVVTAGRAWRVERDVTAGTLWRVVRVVTAGEALRVRNVLMAGKALKMGGVLTAGRVLRIGRVSTLRKTLLLVRQARLLLMRQA